MTIQIPDFTKARVLIIGDMILDRYWHGNVDRISPEAPVPIMLVQHVKERLGGAGNPALNIATLGAKTTFIGLVGKDEPAKKIKHYFKEAHIDYHLHEVEELPTIVKIRALGKSQQLLRIDF